MDKEDTLSISLGSTGILPSTFAPNLPNCVDPVGVAKAPVGLFENGHRILKDCEPIQRENSGQDSRVN